MSKLLLMCFEFFKAGLFAVGGGLATIPFLSRIAENHPDWYTIEDLANMIAVAESTPGPIGVNVATYAGFSSNGIVGAIIATIFLVLPSFLCVLIIHGFWKKYKENDKVQRVFSALRPAGLGLISSACFTVILNAVYGTGTMSFICLAIFLAFLAVLQIPKLKNVHPIVFILIAAVLGIVLKL